MNLLESGEQRHIKVINTITIVNFVVQMLKLIKTQSHPKTALLTLKLSGRDWRKYLSCTFLIIIRQLQTYNSTQKLFSLELNFVRARRSHIHRFQRKMSGAKEGRNPMQTASLATETRWLNKDVAR